MATDTTTVRFFFDPLCPWAWRTSLWMREVRSVRPVALEWAIFSLEGNNDGLDGLRDGLWRSGPAFRTIALLHQRLAGPELHEAIDAFYLALGRATHERRENIGKHEVTAAALREAGLEAGLLDEALADTSTIDWVLAAHAEAVGIGAFGVPTLLLRHPARSYPDKGAFGPVIDSVPEGEDAGELWDHLSALIARPEFYEIKRPR